MKTRMKDRPNLKSQATIAVSHINTTSASGVQIPSNFLVETAAGTESITSAITAVGNTKGQQPVTSSIMVDNFSKTQTISRLYSTANFGAGLSQIWSPSQKAADSTSPANTAGVVEVKVSQYSVPDRQSSPVQLTELVSPPAMSKTSSPLSDKNHNLPSTLVTSTDHVPCSTANHCQVPQPPQSLTAPSSLPSVELATSYYYHDLSQGKTVDSYNQYSVLPVYPKDSLYPPHQYMVDNNVAVPCTMDAGQQYSEVNSYNSSSSCYTSPVTSSVASSQSPDILPRSADSTQTLPSESRLSRPTGALQPALPQSQGGSPELEKFASDSVSTTTYYSDEQSLEEDASMRDIKQDILMSDIHKHIYQNVSQSLSFSLMEEQQLQSHGESQSEGEGGTTAGKSNSGTKKRRRRTQTPVQRTAANMRERKRMCHLNTAFDCLKDRLPNVRTRKKLSRIQTLKAAIFYIGLLSECVHSG